jgi:hypothetical protein
LQLISLTKDGRNIHFLAQECSFQEWIIVFYKEDMLKESLVPGYPKATGEKTLATWCALLSGADLIQEQTPMDVDEKIFVMRPFVFACAKVGRHLGPANDSTILLMRRGTIAAFPCAKHIAMISHMHLRRKPCLMNDLDTVGSAVRHILLSACTCPFCACWSGNPLEWVSNRDPRPLPHHPILVRLLVSSA